MAQNFVQDGDRIKLPVTADKLSGDWDMVGDLPVVLTRDADSNDEAMCATKGVFDLSVVAQGAATPVAIAIGDKIYADGSELNKDSTNGKEFGIALGAVTSDETITIPVRLKG